MLRLSFGRPPWRFVFLLACTMTLAGWSATSSPSDQSQPAQERTSQQDRARDPDERAAGEEALQDGPEPEGTATLLLAPSRLAIAPGRVVTISLSVLGARDLSRLPVTIHYDAGILEIASVNLGSAWRDRPRPVFLHDASRPGEIVVGLAQMNPSAGGISGTAELLEIRVRALRPGDAELYLDRFALIAAGSKSQPVQALPASIVVR